MMGKQLGDFVEIRMISILFEGFLGSINHGDLPIPHFDDIDAASNDRGTESETREDGRIKRI